MRKLLATVAARENEAPAASSWLPPGKAAAVCFSIDDVHPASSREGYEAGGDLAAGALGRLVRLQKRHPQLKATLCVTPDWRLKSLVPAAGILRHIPWTRRRVHWPQLHRPGRFRMDRHPQLVAYLNGLERCEVVPHGLFHAHVGPRFAVEFQDETEDQCARVIARGLQIFTDAKLNFVNGYVPPAWSAPSALIAALERMNFQFIMAARDLGTAITPDAVVPMSGLADVSLIYPQLIGNGTLVHFTCNFQATSPIDRAVQILDAGGLLHIKAHAFKRIGSHVMLDGLDDLYCNYLDLLLRSLDRRFGDRLWWTHVSEVAARVRSLV
jgi:hypothetical protein